jgi:hypothetical protein
VRREQQDRALARARAAVALDEERARRRDAEEREKIAREFARADAAEARRVLRNADRAAEVARKQREADREAAVRGAEVEREERRRAQRDRVARLARAETYKAAADAVQEAAEKASEVLGWTRLLGPNACPTCIAWWNEPPFGRVRPMTVRMKRHVGCDCKIHLVIHKEEVIARGYTTDPEPVSERYKRSRDRKRDAARAAEPADA